MSAVADLERGYRRWLRCYPRRYRREHEAEILGVLLAGAREGQRRPGRAEIADLMTGALRMRLRPRVPRSDRATLAAIRLMYAGAVVELTMAATILATLGDVRTAIVARQPAYTLAQWHTEAAGKIEPLAMWAGLGAAFWLWMAWANGRGHRWARIAFAVFFVQTSCSLLTGLAGGSAVYARADLAVGAVLWLVELAVVVLVFHADLRKVAAWRPGAGRITPQC